MRTLDELKRDSKNYKQSDTYGPSADDPIYQKYLAAKPKVAGGTANPTISANPQVRANQNLTKKPSETYAAARKRNRAAAAKLSAGLENAKATAQEVKDILFSGRNYGTVNPTFSLGKEYDTMTPAEAGAFVQLTKQGKTKQAEEYLKTLQMELNERNAEIARQRAKETAEKSTLGGVGLDVAGAASSGAGALYSLWQEARGKAIDPYHPAFGGVIAKEGAHEGLMGDSTGVEKFLKEAALATAEWGGQALGFGALTPVVMAAGAAGASSRDATLRGGTSEEATMYGLLSGTAEMVAEKIGFDRLFRLGETLGTAGVKGLLKDAAKSMAPEAAEEALTEVANILSDVIVMGNKSNMAQIMAEARANGATDKEALQAAIGQGLKDVAYSGGLGAVSGGMIGGGVSGLNRVLGRNALDRQRVPINAVDNTVEEVENGVERTNNGVEMPGTAERTPAILKEPVRDLEAEYEEQVKAEMQAESETPEIYEELEDFGEKFYGEKGKEVFLRRARENGNLDHTPAFNTYYRAGVAGITESEIKQTAYTAGADKMMLNEAYMAGAMDRKAEIANAIKGKNKLTGKRGLILGEDVKATEAQLAITKLYAEVGGVRIRLVDKITSPIEGTKINGYQEGDTITIAMNADSFMGTLHHEMVHYIRKVNPTGYDSMRELVFNLANKSGIDMDKRMEEYRVNYEDTYGEDADMMVFMEEMVADAFQKITSDQTNFANFINDLWKTEPTILEKIKEFLDQMLGFLESLLKDNTYTAFAEEISKDKENLKKLRKKFAKALTETGKMEAEDRASAHAEGARYSITLGMTEEERYQELKDRDILVYSDTETEKHSKDFATIEELQKTAKNSTRKEIKKLAEKLGVLHKEIKTPEVEFEFILSGEGLRESFNKQTKYGGSYLDFAKAIANLDKIMETAILLEEHEDKYKGTERESRVLEKVSVLFGAFRDGSDIIPVQMEIKKSSTDSGRLYMTVAMTKIEAGVIETRRENPEHGSLVPTSIYRLADIFGEINIADRNFLKYVPDGFLDEAQRTAKADALRAERAKIEGMKKKIKEKSHPAAVDKNITSTILGDSSIENVAQLEDEGKRKFSMRKNDIEAAIAESEHWKKAYEGLLKEFEITKEPLRDREAAKKVVRKFLKSIKSSYDEEKFLDRFVSLCNYGADMQGDSNYRDLVTAMTMLSEDALKESAELDTEIYDKYADLRKELRSATLYVSADTEKELEAQDIKYNELRTENFNKVKISRKSGGGIDTHYEAWAEKYPELFKLDQHTSQAALLMDIVAVRKSLDPVVKNPYFEQLEDYAESFAYELLGMMNDIALEDQTFADKYEEKLRKQREESKQALKNAKEQAKNEKKLLRERYATNAEARIEAVKQKYEKRLDRKEYWRLRKLAVKDAKALAEWLKTPTDKNHIPKKFKESVETVLALIDTDKPDLRIPLKSFVAMRGGLMELYGDTQGIYLYVEQDDQVINILDRFIQKYPDGANLDTMDGTDMKYFRNLIASVKKACMDANKLHTSQREKTSVSVSEGFINASQAKKDARETGMIRRVQDFLGLEMLDANSFFKRIGGDVYSELWKGLRKGMDKKVLRWKETIDFINNLVDPKDVRAWTDEAAKEFEIGGVKVYLTIPQIMSLACLMRRSQGRQHIIGMDIPTENGILQIKGGGFKAEPLGKDKKAKLEKAKVVEPNEAEVRAIIATLTEEQARVAYAMQQYLSNEVAAWGNETSMMMFGYEKFLTENYFPIVSDKNFVNQLVTKVEDIAPSLRSMGITKNVNQYANNPVIIQDIFKVFANHVDQMSNYNAFVASESDFNKFMNYKVKRDDGRIYSVKDEMDRTMGAGGAKYIKTLMNRLVTTTGLSDDSDFAKMFVRNMKVASVGANLRVIVQQPTAYLRAANYLDLKYLLNPAIFKKTDREIIYRYAPIALWKSWGNYEMDTGKTMYEQIIAPTKFAWTKEKLMAGAGAADSWTWSRLWNACELEARDKHPGLSDEEIYKIAGERFGEIVDESQVVDSILHRSQIMRKKGLYTQMATSFMSEPTKTFNMASNALVELLRENTPENRKKFARCYMTIIATGIATACAAGLVDAMRDDDDEEEFLEKWKKAVRGDYSEAETPKDYVMEALSNNIADNLNPMNMIPYLRDVWSLIQGYDIKRTDFDWLNDILKSMKRWENFIAGESEYTLSSMLMNTAGAVSKMAGVPIGSATRDLKAVSNLIVLHIIGEDEAKYKYRKLSKDIGSEKNTGDYVERMLQAKFSGNDGLATRIYNEMIEAGVSNEKIDSKIDTKEKTLLKEEPAAAEAATAYAAGDYDGYTKALNSLTDKGYGKKNAIKAIESIYKNMKGEREEEEETFETITQGFWEDEPEEDPAGYEMMFNAYMNGSKADYNQMWNKLEAAGKKESSIKQSMKNRLKAAYRAAKADGNYQEAQKAKSEFLRLGGKPETLEKE